MAMVEEDRGGPAFPRHERHAVMRESSGGWRDEWLAVDGMSLRDYFAAQAIDIASKIEQDYPTGARGAACYEGVATRAYLLADAMLKARSEAR